MTVEGCDDPKFRWADLAAWFLYISFALFLFGGFMVFVVIMDAVARHEIGK